MDLNTSTQVAFGTITSVLTILGLIIAYRYRKGKSCLMVFRPPHQINVVYFAQLLTRLNSARSLILELASPPWTGWDTTWRSISPQIYPCVLLEELHLSLPSPHDRAARIL